MTIEVDPKGLFLLGQDGLQKADTTVHHPPDTQCVAQTEAGPIFRIPLTGSQDRQNFEPPQSLLELTRNRIARERIMSTLNLNSRRGPQEVGRPNSAFLFDQGGFFIDHLLEDHDHERSTSPTLHNVIRESVSYQDARPIYGRVSVLSGHLAAFTSEEEWVAYVMSLDAFSGKNAFEQIPQAAQVVVDTLWVNRIAPLTADGYVITPST